VPPNGNVAQFNFENNNIHGDAMADYFVFWQKNWNSVDKRLTTFQKLIIQLYFVHKGHNV